MSDLDREIRRGLERLTGPRGGAARPTVEKLAERRRQRRVRRTAVVAVPAIALVATVGVVGAGILGSGGDDRADVAVGDGGGHSGSATASSQPEPTVPDAGTTQPGPGIEPGSHTLDESEADAARDVVAGFLDDLRAGDLEAAAERWTGYPELTPEAPVEERIPFIEDLLARSDFSRIVRQDGTEVFVNPSWGWTGADPVVTVLAPHDGRDLPVAAAFTMGYASVDDGGPMMIQRLPRMERPPGEQALFTEASSEIEVRGQVPVEGGARAFIDEVEVPVAIDHDAGTMSFSMPDDAEGDVAVTVTLAGPELPGAFALAHRLGPP